MDNISQDNILIFLIPGFILVWSFRYFAKIKDDSDFKFLSLSFFWGLVNMVLYELFMIKHPGIISKTLENPYSASLFLSILAAIFGLTGAIISKSKIFKKSKEKFFDFFGLN